MMKRREAAAAANAREAEVEHHSRRSVKYHRAEVKSTAVSLNSTVSDLKAQYEVLTDPPGAQEQADAQKACEDGPSPSSSKA